MNPKLAAVLQAVNHIVLGKPHQAKLALACLLARGHLLIEDLPGVGKTTLSHVLARVLGLEFRRIQFTSDLLPADIIGISVFNRDEQQFDFHPGPIFAQVILADEINRATPKSQSALLEAMEEGQVTSDGKTRPLPTPFFVIATQNPQDQVGTFPLPESQLDRFLMRLSIGYPDRTAERMLLKGEDRRGLLQQLQAVLQPTEVEHWQGEVQGVTVSDALLDYVQALLAHTRESGWWVNGLSPRAGLGLLQAARAWALLEGRGHVLPEDVQTVLYPVAAHRLTPAHGDVEASPARIDEWVKAVPIP